MKEIGLVLPTPGDDIYISELGHHWFRSWMDTNLAITVFTTQAAAVLRLAILTLFLDKIVV